MMWHIIQYYTIYNDIRVFPAASREQASEVVVAKKRKKNCNQEKNCGTEVIKQACGEENVEENCEWRRFQGPVTFVILRLLPWN